MAKKFKQKHEENRKKQGLSKMQYYQIGDRCGSGDTSASHYDSVIREKFVKMNNKKKEQLDNIISDMLEWVSILTNEVIEESKKYSPEQEGIFMKGAAWMLYRLVRNRGQRRIYICKDMNLDEAIKHCEEVIPLAESSQCVKEHMQLRNWLLELKDYRNRCKD